eukprot:Lithocolla_globosa_v1_NODE_969_length_3008_cov_31.801219.p2 type:complete len:138 gc:universal NODE_969_length_3008_cov_31.801219:392-805(+)
MIFITGDGNAHHHDFLGSTDCNGQGKTDAAGKELNCLAIDRSLEQLVTENTYLRNTGEAKSILDLVLTDHPNLVESVKIKPPISSTSATSPHPVIESIINIAPTIEQLPPRKVWIYKKGDFNQLQHCIKNNNWLPLG